MYLFNRNDIIDKGIISYFYPVFRAMGVDSEFLLYRLNNGLKQQITMIAEGTGQHVLSLKKFKKIITSVPLTAEQYKIGDLFKNLDMLITFHQRKLAQLTAFKKAMLGKMFPQEGARVPEVRFSGFTDNWEQRKLGDLAEIGDIDHKMPQTVDDGIPYLMTGDFIGINELNFSEVKMISKADYERLANKIKPQKGDILFARYATVGAVRYVNFERDFLISYSCAIIKSSTKIVSKFLYQFLTSVLAQTQIKLEINTGSQANIGIDSMKNNIIVSMPTKDEQKKIGDFFFELDNLITIHQHKLTVLQQAKQSLLQKMFI
jgi:type I restriction enzyme S subunit